jgi:D-alanyl-D-alanine carboxypeptidase/D-alanyl-D-alanine-endopeptidase (penicillin-binding protein 4)
MSAFLRLRARPATLVVLISFAQVGAAVALAVAHGPAARPRVRAVAAPAAPAATPAGTPVPTPVPTPAVPTPEQVLVQRVDAAVAGYTACLVVRDGRRTVLDRGDLLAPASTQKLLVASAAVSALGREFRFVTRAVAAAPAQDGVLDAMWLVGSGDPGLATNEYTAWLQSKQRWRDVALTPLSGLADHITASGVKTVRAIHGDDSRYDAVRALPGWKPSYLTDGEIGPLGALTVNEGFSSWTPKHVRADQPAVYAASELGRLLSERGVVVGPAVDAAVAPAGAVAVAEVASASLDRIVAGMLRSSDNLVAELLTREIGRRDAGDGSTQAGLAAIAARLRKLGIATAGLRLNDGSGLDGANRASCRTLADSIDRGGITDLLAVAGEAGTLLKRNAFGGTLRAKTGWITGVVGITGVLDVGRPFRFSLVVNGVTKYETGLAVEEAVLQAIADYARSCRLGPTSHCISPLSTRTGS